jgi:hypothetical protein
LIACLGKPLPSSPACFDPRRTPFIGCYRSNPTLSRLRGQSYCCCFVRDF